VRIPLDYYRILGLPIQATPDQLRQAHRDRTLQLPRREYSDAAINSRKMLLDEAYAVLSDPNHRQSYDASFLAKTYDLPPQAELAALPQPQGDSGLDPHTPSIEIQDDQLVGALLVFQELGEYELVLKLGRPFLTGGSASLNGGQFGNPTIVYSDIVLTVALACLELGREQWQQGQYENAAEALETGEKLLLREGLFASVRGEIQADLYKLRPYRILELLALPQEHTTGRHRGMHLLQDMLQERGGIDGTSNDQSGLSIDDFLRFIQQLRSYLTAAEQQVLFEEESRRPSAVATYLAVYALLSRGFAEHTPGLVRRAKHLLMRLSLRQDVHLEQSVCALLLGQTEEASRALEHSQEYAPIAFIREHSQGSPDLLPGLCLYAERWLQDEVFPHFRDLATQKAALKDYFADHQVQTYLENLPHEPELADEWSIANVPTAATYTASSAHLAGSATSASRINGGYREPMVAATAGRSFATDRDSVEALVESARVQAASRMATAAASGRFANGGAMPAAERVDQPGSEPQPDRRLVSDRARSTQGRTGGGQRASGNPVPRRAGDRPSRSRPSLLMRWLLPSAILLSLVLLGFLAAWLFRTWQLSRKSALEQPLVQLDRPLVDLSPPPSGVTAGSLTSSLAQQVIESWLAAKSAAMGSDHAIEKLDGVLAEPKLTEWRNAAADAKQGNWYKQYKHTVKVTSVQPSKTKPDEAEVSSEISESTDYYEAGSLKDSKSDPNLRIQYRLIRKDNQWRIQNWNLL